MQPETLGHEDVAQEGMFREFSERYLGWQVQLAYSIIFPFVHKGIGTAFSMKIWGIFLRIILGNEANFTWYLLYAKHCVLCFSMLLFYEHLTTVPGNIISFISEIRKWKFCFGIAW